MDARTALDEQSHGCIAEAILKKMAEFGVASAKPAEIVEAQAFAARLIGPNIAQAETLRRVHRTTGVGLFVAREDGEIAGVVAFVPLNTEGLRATRNETFRAVDPAPAHISAWGEDPAGLYGWGVAAASSRAARQLVAGYEAMVRLAIPHLPVFARAATVLGERLLTKRLNYRPYPGSRTGLLWIEPYAERGGIAA